MSTNPPPTETTPLIPVSDEVHVRILRDYIEPSYKADVQEMIGGRKCYRQAGQVFETMSKVLVACGGILSFSAGVYNYPTLSFVAGSISTFSLACLQFSSFCYKESKHLTTELNTLLRSLQIDTVPSLNPEVVTVPSVTDGDGKASTNVPPT